jgi:hypothetical protein
VDRPAFVVDERTVKAYSAMFNIPLAPQDAEVLAADLSLVLQDLSRLWILDVTDHEMALIYPVRRG